MGQSSGVLFKKVSAFHAEVFFNRSFTVFACKFEMHNSFIHAEKYMPAASTHIHVTYPTCVTGVKHKHACMQDFVDSCSVQCRWTVSFRVHGALVTDGDAGKTHPLHEVHTECIHDLRSVHPKDYNP